ncbi:carbohydrate ABC transporter permease [Scatolibacter rhodanostii]|uniref:carbohydrate ABC transporter permease n=1 Tax=Scatolibacter rhodanostii TaxID=2014781 RepID=UPI000C076383|nr:carbohydrate ABC transporter permease [Scatolibacter rhodanostii]
MVQKKKAGDYVFYIVTIAIVGAFLLTIAYPFLNSLAISLNDAKDTALGGLSIIPRKFTLSNYTRVFKNSKIYQAYFITISRTIVGTAMGFLFTAMLSYGLSNKNLMGRKFYTMICLIPMYFSGGIIPTYFLMQSLHLTNSFWVYILPNLVGLWNMILMRTYFSQIPDAMEESARIDGANYFTIFFKIILPVSGTIIATIVLYIAVFQWNAWFDASIYINNKDELKPLQSILMQIVNEAKYAETMAQQGMSADQIAAAGAGKDTNVRSITMATMIITILPIIVTYPFLQKYFIQGVMVGSVKG